MRYLFGEDALTAFLRRYEEGAPPVLLSNGFPGDYLPCPAVRAPSIDASAPLDQQRSLFGVQRQRRKLLLIPIQQFNQVISSGDLNFARQVAEGGLSTRRVTLKNQLSRLTATTGAAGALYSFDEYFSPEVTVYAKVAGDFVDSLRRLLDYLIHVGYGKRKSAGYGHIANAELQQFQGFDSPVDANGFVTLSNFVPAADDPCNGNWTIVVKYGKLGEERAVSGQVFKKPLLMLAAGSTFYDWPCREYYGRLVRGLNPAHADVVQYGLALPVPMRLPELVLHQ
jgi:CRISPR-associated protein Csm4